MGFFGWLNGRKKRSGESDFLSEMEAYVRAAREREGTLEEILPQGQGEFGLSPDNPIPFSSIAASREYLENLILIKPGSSAYRWMRSGSVRSSVVETPVDKYDLVDTDSSIVTSIYIWSYNKVDSKKVPEGFGLME